MQHCKCRQVIRDQKTGAILGYGKTYTVAPEGLAAMIKRDPGATEFIEMVEVDDDLRLNVGKPKYTPIDQVKSEPKNEQLTVSNKKATP